MQYLITCCFMALDFVTGLVYAFSSKSFSSTKMREGLFHKTGLLLVMILGVLVETSEDFLDLGVTIPVAAAVCAYICLMEIGSIIENVCKIVPDLAPEKLTSYFAGLTLHDSTTSAESTVLATAGVTGGGREATVTETTAETTTDET